MSGYLIEAKKQLSVLLNTRKDVLCGGHAKDFAQYKQLVGEKTGIELAMQIITDLQKRIDINNGDIDED